MAHIFKPGDRAYWFEKNIWLTLTENVAGSHPLRAEDRRIIFTVDGRYAVDRDIVLLPLNPYDPTDPLNPPEFRYPFMLNGKPVFAGSELHHLGYRKTSVVTALFLEDVKQWCGLKNTSVGELSPKNFCWPDEIPAKKKVAKWAYPVIGMPGADTVGFTEEMTQEEARRAYGSSIRMIPGTEREVEG